MLSKVVKCRLLFYDKTRCILRIFSKNGQSFLCFWTALTTQVVVILSKFNKLFNNIYV
ncbi:hypothetical protein Hanom_Chr04g00343031 [Helianthus anomalus]